MSLPFLITSPSWDGATVINLTQPASVDPDSEVNIFTPNVAGILDLTSLGFGDMWIQVVSTNPDVGDTLQVDIVYQDGTAQNVVPLGAGNAIWNLLAPQGSRLRVQGAGAAPFGGSVFFTVWRIAATQWPELQCCHLFAPAA